MKRRVLLVLGIAALGCVGLTALHFDPVLWAQGPALATPQNQLLDTPQGPGIGPAPVAVPLPQPAQPHPGLPATEGFSPFGGPMMLGPGSAGGETPADPRHGLRAQIEEVKRRIAAAKGDSDRSKEVGQLSELLSQYFDRDMEFRRKQLETIKQRVAELEQHLQRRQSAKSDILELQQRVLVNEADGLGFFTQPPSQQLFGRPAPAGEMGPFQFAPPVEAPF